MRPPLFIILFAFTCGIAVAVTCAFCAAQPNKIAAYMRHKHLSSPRWLRNWPFAGMVMKEWYPVYLRVVGIGGFVCALAWLTQLTRIFSK
jgi:hypothetical protein